MTHGKVRGYDVGCRCAQCKAAKAAYTKKMRSRGDTPNHGTLYGYQGHGCRCLECTEAASSYCRVRAGGSPPKLSAPKYGTAPSTNNNTRIRIDDETQGD